MASEKIRLTLTGSYIGCTQPQRRTLKALGLRKREQSREHETSAPIMGMVDVVKHLISVEPVE